MTFFFLGMFQATTLSKIDARMDSGMRKRQLEWSVQMRWIEHLGGWYTDARWNY